MAEPIRGVEYVEVNGMTYPLPIAELPVSLRHKTSSAGLSEQSDNGERENRSTSYQSAHYATLLAAKGSYMKDSELGITTECREWDERLLNEEQTLPTNSLFQDDMFEVTCANVQNRNQQRVIRSITPYIVPSAEDLATMGSTELKCLVECVSERWTSNFPVVGSRPQPNYSVGFRRSAFTDQQLQKLYPLIGTPFDKSYFAATFRMLFPFFTCKVGCNASALDVADRQNAHSMTIAVRAVVELYRSVNREEELHRKILAFSISHDHRMVRIYGHYPILEGSKTSFYSHPIHEFSFVALDGRDKWTAYKFTRNVYEKWMPDHLERLRSAIDRLPLGLNLTIPDGSELCSTADDPGPSTAMGSVLAQPDAGSFSILESASNFEPAFPAVVLPLTVTPETSVSQETTPAKNKKGAKRRRTAE